MWLKDYRNGCATTVNDELLQPELLGETKSLQYTRNGELKKKQTNQKNKIVPKVPVSPKYKFHSGLGSCLFDNCKFRFYIHPTQEIENVKRNLK